MDSLNDRGKIVVGAVSVPFLARVDGSFVSRQGVFFFCWKRLVRGPSLFRKLTTSSPKIGAIIAS